MKKRMASLCSLAGLAVLYWVVRYPLFALHGMKEWPLDLFVFGVVIIAVSGLLLCGKVLPVCTAAGYGAGFGLGVIFQFDYGHSQNSLWIIWTGVYLVLILAGVMAEFLLHRGACYEKMDIS